MKKNLFQSLLPSTQAGRTLLRRVAAFVCVLVFGALAARNAYFRRHHEGAVNPYAERIGVVKACMDECERVIRTAFPRERCLVAFIGSTQRDGFVQEVRHFKISGAADATQQQLQKICEDLATRSPLRTESHTEQHEGGFLLKVVVSQ